MIYNPPKFTRFPTNPPHYFNSPQVKTKSCHTLLLITTLFCTTSYTYTTEQQWRSQINATVSNEYEQLNQLAIALLAIALCPRFAIGHLQHRTANLHRASATPSKPSADTALTATPLFIAGATSLLPETWINTPAALGATLWLTYLAYSGEAHHKQDQSRPPESCSDSYTVDSIWIHRDTGRTSQFAD